MNSCEDTEWRDFQIVDAKVDNRHMAVTRLQTIFKDVAPVHTPFPVVGTYMFPTGTYDYKDEVVTQTKTRLGSIKHDLSSIPVGKTALHFPEAYLGTVERALVLLASVPNAQDSPTMPADFQPRPNLTDQNNGVAKRKEAIRWLQEVPMTAPPTTALANLTDILTFHTYLHALSSEEKATPTWVDHPVDQAELDVHNEFWSMYYSLAKRIDMKMLDREQHDLEISRQPITVRGVYFHSLNNLVTTLLVCPYDTTAIAKAHQVVMDDTTLLPSLKDFGHNLYSFFTTVYLASKEQYADLSSSARKTSTVEFIVAEAKKVRAFEDVVHAICADVAFKLEVLEITFHSRMILYDDLSQVYHQLDKATLSAITTDLGCPEGIQWILQETHTSKKVDDTLSGMSWFMLITLIALVVFIAMKR
jgi:hypothetical protein